MAHMLKIEKLPKDKIFVKGQFEMEIVSLSENSVTLAHWFRSGSWKGSTKYINLSKDCVMSVVELYLETEVGNGHLE